MQGLEMKKRYSAQFNVLRLTEAIWHRRSRGGCREERIPRLT